MSSKCAMRYIIFVLLAAHLCACFITSSAFAARVRESEEVPAIPDIVSGGSQDASLESNIFSNPSSENNQTPAYVTEGNSQDSNSQNDDTPDFEHIRLIPSLTVPQRKQIRAIYDQLKQDIAPLQTDLKSIRQQIQELKNTKQGAALSNTTSGATARRSSASPQTDAAQSDATISKPWLRPLASIDSQSPMAKTDQPSDIKSLRKQAASLVQDIKGKRLAAWDQVSQDILRPEQVEELNRMRRGEIVGGN